MMTAHAAVALKPANSIAELQTQLHSLPAKQGVIQQLSIALDPVNILAVMASNQTSEQCYWQDRTGEIEMAGFGNAIDLSGENQAALEQSLSIIESLNCHSKADLLWFGGFAFAEQVKQALPYCYFRLPQIALIQHQNRCRLVVNVYGDDTLTNTKALLTQALANINWQEQSLSGRESRRLYSAEHNCAIEQWRQKVNHTLQTIRQGNLSKAVLTRQTRLRTARNIPVHSLLHNWKQARPNAYSFMMQWQDQYFIGHSPERLFRRHGERLTTDALAGTVKLDTPDALAKLSGDPKLVHEHAVVADYLQQKLQQFSKTVERGKTSSLSLRNIAHRHCVLTAKLWPSTKTSHVIGELHPTPAVGGFPKRQAMQYLSVNECNRDWYAGGIGVIGRWQAKDYSDFSVAIRSAMVKANQMTCFTGVGIVEGSNPDEEWQELDNKLASVIGALHDG